ncbi:MAG: ABC-type transport auxiliary lipoprotein family protein [Kiloniellaceae bacterium]
MARAGAALLLVAALGGCLGAAPPVPRDHYYRIVVPVPTGPTAVSFEGVIDVPPIAADGLLRERPLLYSPGGDSNEMLQHDYHYWSEPPPRMLQMQLVDYLRRSGVATMVVTPDLRVPADYEVSGRIRRLERLLGDGPPRVVAELELAMIGTAGGRLVVIQSYRAERTAADGSVASSVQAMNQALEEIFARFVNDAGRSETALRPKSGD